MLCSWTTFKTRTFGPTRWHKNLSDYYEYSTFVRQILYQLIWHSWSRFCCWRSPPLASVTRIVICWSTFRRLMMTKADWRQKADLQDASLLERYVIFHFSNHLNCYKWLSLFLSFSLLKTEPYDQHVYV